MLIMGLISFIPVFHYEAFHFETLLQFRHITALSSNFQTCVKKYSRATKYISKWKIRGRTSIEDSTIFQIQTTVGGKTAHHSLN